MLPFFLVLSIALGVPQQSTSPGEKLADTERIYQVAPDKLFVAAAQVAAQKWNVTHSDKDTYTVSFKTGANMRTWKGFEVSVVCVELKDGWTKMQLHPQKRPTGQLFSWNEGGRIASQFYEALEKRLREMELLPKPAKK